MSTYTATGPFGSFQHLDDVILCRRGESLSGTLYLAEHHLVFSWLQTASPAQRPRQRQVWITFPIIAHATLRIFPLAARQRCAIRLKCRDFTFVALQFAEESQARSTFGTIKSLTCELTSLDKLLAYSYRSPPEETTCNGWHRYDARAEYRRMGIGPKETDKGWRVSEINIEHTFSPTYPSLLVIPSTVSDNVLKHGGTYRSKVRVPALTYLHSVNNCSITRSSQPMVGLFKGKRNAQDERLVAAIFATSRPQSDHAVTDDEFELPRQASAHHSGQIAAEEATHDIGNNTGTTVSIKHSRSEPDVKSARVYGAQQRNLIVDARPTLNARVNQAAGMGSENMEFYKDASIKFLGIDNIHVMRESLHKVMDALAHTDYTNLPPDQDLLTRSKWLKYIKLLLRGADLVARQIGLHHSHVLIHCSDGWDRTSQISALSQLCLDPYYRTIEGFIVLVEKDWLAFGHMFRRRSGPLSSTKWFEVEDERPTRTQDHNPSAGQASVNTISNAFLSAKGFFLKRRDSSDSLEADSGSGRATAGSDLGSSHSRSGSTIGADDNCRTKPSETSPMFHQFLDATWQLLRQHPTRFEYNERFLRRLLYHVYACQYGTFLYDSEAERKTCKATDRTHSVWDYFLARKDQFVNDRYVATIDDKTIGQERLLFPDINKLRWWADVFGRTDVEMNGTSSAPAPSLPPRDDDSVDVGDEITSAAGSAANAMTYGYESNDPFIFGAEKLKQSLSGISLAIRAGTPTSRAKTPPRQEEKEDSLEAMSAEPARHVENELSAQAFARDAAFSNS